MKERGMIFNGEMVRAILDGRKTQTRREVKLNLDIACLATTYDWATSLAANHYQGLTEEQIQQKAESLRGVIHPVILDNGQMVSIICPHGKPGDRIWVRETFCPVDDTQYGGEKWVDYRATPKFEESHPAGWDSAPNDAEALKWRPSIHMPRWASRILLEITNVGVQRLQDISSGDAVREGICQLPASGRYCVSPGDQYFGGASRSAKEVYSWLWSSIYGEESWKANPWVWVIEFKRIEGGAA
ncbi:morphogenetic protein [Klebsiella pneumoniae]|uniref:Morphogenetic protein n=1 Tax=Klebsiella pneumoniae TaxID=573 RepID=A0A4P0XVW3_KLEPN|nr:morphogenetic protein [Klebsiella pneumoniae]